MVDLDFIDILALMSVRQRFLVGLSPSVLLRKDCYHIIQYLIVFAGGSSAMHTIFCLETRLSIRTLLYLRTI
jgi:hypothetical protein